VLFRSDEGVELDDEEKAHGADTVRGEAIDTAVSLSKLHHAELAPRIDPQHIERRFVLELKDFPMDLAGTIDIQEKTPVVRDTKTANKSPVAGAADNSDQLTMYGLAVRCLDGKDVLLCMDHLVKNKVPKAVTQMTTRTKEDYECLLRRVSAACRVIESGAFMPCSQDSWCCSKAFCGFFTECPYSRKKVQVPI
jgi:RecB family exonuclease